MTGAAAGWGWAPAALLSAFALLVPSLAASGDFGPFDAPGHPVTSEARAARARTAGDSLPPAHFFWLSYRFYNRVVSPLQGARCSHRPTCSAYAMSAVRRHGAVPGLWLTVERLMLGTNSSALRVLPMAHTPEGVRFLHPLEDALFWLERDEPADGKGRCHGCETCT